jgi:hypothetical protein
MLMAGGYLLERAVDLSTVGQVELGCVVNAGRRGAGLMFMWGRLPKKRREQNRKEATIPRNESVKSYKKPLYCQ